MTELLDLSKVAERDTVRMPGGVSREIIKNTDLGAYEFAHLANLQADARKIETSIRTGKMTAAKETQLRGALAKIVKFLVPTVTPGELAKLSRANLEQIILTWIGRNIDAGGDQGNAPSPLRGGSSSRVSRRSTAATRKAGSTRRRTS